MIHLVYQYMQNQGRKYDVVCGDSIETCLDDLSYGLKGFFVVKLIGAPASLQNVPTYKIIEACYNASNSLSEKRGEINRLNLNIESVNHIMKMRDEGKMTLGDEARAEIAALEPELKRIESELLRLNDEFERQHPLEGLENKWVAVVDYDRSEDEYGEIIVRHEAELLDGHSPASLANAASNIIADDGISNFRLIEILKVRGGSSAACKLRFQALCDKYAEKSVITKKLQTPRELLKFGSATPVAAPHGKLQELEVKLKLALDTIEPATVEYEKALFAVRVIDSAILMV